MPYWTTYSFDTYIVVYSLKDRVFMSKSEDGQIVRSDLEGFP